MVSSRRGYLTIEELQEFADITVTDTDEALDRISQAEEIIDAYVGFQQKFTEGSREGEVSSASATKVYDTTNGTQLNQVNNYYQGCEIEIIGGTGLGQSRRITSSSRTEMSVTVADPFSPVPDATSVFRVYQVAKFPRLRDVTVNRRGDTYYAVVPQAVRRATAAQMQFMIAMGDDYFSDNSADMQSESIGKYSYSNGSNGQSAIVKMVAPKVRNLLKGITNRGGRVVAENPTCL